jgi:hypothetical protein
MPRAFHLMYTPKENLRSGSDNPSVTAYITSLHRVQHVGSFNHQDVYPVLYIV